MLMRSAEQKKKQLLGFQVSYDTKIGSNNTVKQLKCMNLTFVVTKSMVLFETLHNFLLRTAFLNIACLEE